MATASGAESDVGRAATLDIGCLLVGAQHTGCVDPSGVGRLAWEARRRTSILASLAPIAVRPTSAQLAEAPIAIWQGSGAPPALSKDASEALALWLGAGGMLLVDAADPAGSASRDAFVRGAEQAIADALGGRAPTQVEANHVVYRSFYLLRDRGPNRPLVRALSLQGRLAVVFSPEPWLAALATEQSGSFTHPVAAGDEDREAVIRMAVNWLMYALCLNYKDDQVHLPYLLERRGRP